MRSPRLRRLALPGLVALLGVFGVRKALRSLGEVLVPVLRHRVGLPQLAPLLGLAAALPALLLARWLWTRAARDRPAKLALGGVAMIALMASYLSSGGATTRGEFHGLLTPAPNSSFFEGDPSRPHVRYDLNAHGFRMPEWTVAKPTGTLRIALVGASFVFGSGVEQEHTLAAELARQATALSPGRSVEALNLGILGDNLASHVEVAKLAEALLDADVTVLCLALPHELARLDAQSERRAPGRLDAFGVVSWALGTQSAIYLWDPDESERDYTPARMARLEEQLALLRAFRREHGERPLFVLVYDEAPAPVRAAFAALPGVRFLPPAPRREDYFLAGDGHPSGLGNRAFAGVIAAALAALP